MLDITTLSQTTERVSLGLEYFLNNNRLGVFETC